MVPLSQAACAATTGPQYLQKPDREGHLDFVTHSVHRRDAFHMHS